MYGQIEDRHYRKKEDESQKLRLGGGSWTINLDELKDKEIDEITLITRFYEYNISYAKAFTNGFIRVLQGETKLVVPIKHWDIIRR